MRSATVTAPAAGQSSGGTPSFNWPPFRNTAYRKFREVPERLPHLLVSILFRLTRTTLSPTRPACKLIQSSNFHWLRVRKSGEKKTWPYRLRYYARWLSCVCYFPRLLVAICRSREPLFSSPSSEIYLKPYDAEDIWMRWACVLVAQVFPQWLDDMQKSGMSDLPSGDGLSEQLARFRRTVRRIADKVAMES